VIPLPEIETGLLTPAAENRLPDSAKMYLIKLGMADQCLSLSPGFEYPQDESASKV